MATLGDLKLRIIAETDRDDLGSGEALEDTLLRCIQRACEYFAADDFWFMRDTGTATTTTGVGYVNSPFAVRLVETVSYLAVPLMKTDIAAIEYLTETGQPSAWAPKGDRIYLWPIPAGAYSLSVYGPGQLDAPEDDSDETVWTNEAYDLIAARVRFLLFRDVFRDVEGTQLAAQAEGEELSRLRKETRRRNVTDLRSIPGDPWYSARPYENITTGQ